MAASSIKIIPDFHTLDYDWKNNAMVMVKSPSASLNSALFGVPKFFIPRWFRPIVNFNEFPQDWTYHYDNTPLAQTIEKYVDFKKISPGSFLADQDNNPNTIRLVVTAANVLTAIVFDSGKIQINIKHLLASTGYPQYGFPGVEAQKNVWDGALLSNSPIR